MRLRTDAPPVSGLPWAYIAGSAVLGLLILGLYRWQPWHSRAAAPAIGEAVAASPGAAAAVSTTDSGGAGAVAAAEPPATASPAVPAAAPPATQTVPPQADATAGAGHASLRLSFSADSWVDVHDAAGRRAFAGNGRANSVKTIAGIAPMRVYLGFASGVQLEINNRAVAIGPQFVAGDVARFEAGADGVLRRDSRAAAMPGVPTRNARPTG